MIHSDFNPSLFHPYYFIRKGLLHKVAQYAPTLHGDLLDFGCGNKPYKPLFVNVASYVGVDFENEGHSHKNEQIDYYYDGKTLPFDDEKFDSIFSSEVFEHIFNLDEILKELNRVLKPGGKLLLTCPFVWPEHEKPYDFARYTRFALQSKLEGSGFEMVVVDKAGNFFTTISQLQQAYLTDVLFPKLTFPFLVKLAKTLVIPVLNIVGLLLNKIFPVNNSLYLSNVIIVQKKADKNL
jgi:SAM-dependent methyltransferase